MYTDSILFESTEIQGHTIGASNIAYNPYVRDAAERRTPAAPARRARAAHRARA